MCNAGFEAPVRYGVLVGAVVVEGCIIQGVLRVRVHIVMERSHFIFYRPGRCAAFSQPRLLPIISVVAVRAVVAFLACALLLELAAGLCEPLLSNGLDRESRMHIIGCTNLLGRQLSHLVHSKFFLQHELCPASTPSLAPIDKVHLEINFAVE